MFDGSRYLLVKDRERELHEAAHGDRAARERAHQSDEMRQSRAGAARRLLTGAFRRG
ncbi:MAG TPA: hypothetical protein VNH38_07705 [Candidatus Dormibacteraeota bacterium]|nr:hypothetical protein [Candidatus Dormibacteraeota bacterium]